MLSRNGMQDGLFYDIRTEDICSLGSHKGNISVEFVPATDQLYNVFLAAAREEGYNEQETCRYPKVSMMFEIIAPFTKSEEIWVFLGVKGEEFETLQLDFSRRFAKKLKNSIEEHCADSLALAPAVARHCFEAYDNNENWF